MSGGRTKLSSFHANYDKNVCMLIKCGKWRKEEGWKCPSWGICHMEYFISQSGKVTVGCLCFQKM